MRRLLSQIFSAGPPPEAVDSSGPHEAGLAAEYEDLIRHQLARLGIAPEIVAIQVREVRKTREGFSVFVGMVRMVRWKRPVSTWLLLSLPLLETRVRRAVRRTWLADYSQFAGIWLHASEGLLTPQDEAELQAAAQ